VTGSPAGWPVDLATRISVMIDASAIPAQSGGVGTYVRELLRCLPAAGVDPTALTQRGDRRSWAGATCSIALVPRPRLFRLVWEQSLLTRAVRNSRSLFPNGELPSVLHSPHYTMPMLFDRSWKPSRVVTIHDLTFFTRPAEHRAAKRLLFTNAIERAAKHADALIAVSQTTADVLNSLIQVRVPVHVIPHGIDHDRFRMSTDDVTDANDRIAVAEFGVPERFFLHLGTIEPRKNIQGLLRAYERFLRARPVDPPALVLAGSSWPGVWERLQPLAAAIEKEHSGSLVVRLGEVPDVVVAPLYRRSLAVAYPSFEEGFGLPALEALACGATVVTSRASVMHEIAGESIIAVDAHDDSSIARGLALAADEHENGDVRRAQLATKCAAKYRWSECARMHADVYRSVS
jgi:glycosyltransferase involved in cell wall biosynthesis